MAPDWLETWSDALLDFPLEGTRTEQLRALVRFAVRAPSSHNSQPWRFRLAGDGLELRADQSRALPVVDPDGRELLISCGAALEYLRIVANRFGQQDDVALFPDAGAPDLVARFRLVGIRRVAPTDEALFDAIPKRYTNRGRLEARPVAPALLRQLAVEARHAGAWLATLDDPTGRDRLAELVMEGDRIQMADPAFRTELASWLRSGLTSADDGMPGYALGMTALTAVMAPLVVRTFDLGNGRAARDRDLVHGSPVLAVIGTDTDDREAWVRTGCALARVLLLASAGGVQASFLNQAVEVPKLRQQLRDLLATPGYPQLVLRLGYGHEGLPTPRRSVEAVLE